MALAEMGFGLNGIGRNGFWPKWHWPKWLLAKLGIGPSGVGRNGFGRSGNKPLFTSNNFKIIQFKSHGIAQTPDLPILKAYPTPGAIS